MAKKTGGKNTQKMAKGKFPKGGGKGASGDALVGKVSQSTIDDIKRMGMTEALKLAGKNGSTAGGAAREFQEGVRRMYGARRLAESKTKYAPVKKLGVNTVLAPKKTPATSTPAPKKDSGNSNTVRNVALGAAAVAALALSKGKLAPLAARLSPGLAKSGVGKVLTGSGKQTFDKVPDAVKFGAKGSFGKTSTQLAGKHATKGEYAMEATMNKGRAEILAKAAMRAKEAAKAAKSTTKEAPKSVVNSAAKEAPKAGKKASSFDKPPAYKPSLTKMALTMGMLGSTNKAREKIVNKKK